jgi:hypothetical protein
MPDHVPCFQHFQRRPNGFSIHSAHRCHVVDRRPSSPITSPSAQVAKQTELLRRQTGIIQTGMDEDHVEAAGALSRVVHISGKSLPLLSKNVGEATGTRRPCGPQQRQTKFNVSFVTCF